ncbi:hypothetical protein TELCIR_01883 [Teladorsagia circumcincta]|uniref:Uncharacterized protein n=1 Tax=Teladorsagia circumcincta TaxID=45464 RepID=A0A2G9V0P1_TELCI|nr:hypothetical protein TELCIR_01883 [Teladorsagia circumcincta]
MADLCQPCSWKPSRSTQSTDLHIFVVFDRT